MKDSFFFNPLDYPILLETPLRRFVRSGWVEHTPFALAIMDIARPRVLVELGTFTGISYCAFCQAAKALETGTRCYAVDTWEGDPQAGFYGQEIYDDLRHHHDPLYADFSTMLRCTFDEALANFEDGSVDLLHIDGLHTYEAVKHDFDTWLPKLSSRGLVLFHDVAEVAPGFGVIDFWKEVTQRYPGFAFAHGHGLGVLAVGPEQPSALRELLNAPEAEQERVRRFFAALGGSRNETEETHAELQAASAELNEIYASKGWKLVKQWRSIKYK